jgi:hypothetical protein
MKETETALNQRSTKHLSIKFSKYFLALLRRVQEYITMIVDLEGTSRNGESATGTTTSGPRSHAEVSGRSGRRLKPTDTEEI